MIEPKDMNGNPDLYRMAVEQNAEDDMEVITTAGAYIEPKAEQATCFDWELLQAIQHLDLAVNACDSPAKRHLLLSAKQVVKGARESD